MNKKRNIQFSVYNLWQWFFHAVILFKVNLNFYLSQQIKILRKKENKTETKGIKQL